MLAVAQTVETMEQPVDGEVIIDGSWYKIGLRGFAFVYRMGEWFKSNKTANAVRRAMNNIQVDGRKMGRRRVSGKQFNN